MCASDTTFSSLSFVFAKGKKIQGSDKRMENEYHMCPKIADSFFGR